MKSLLLVKQIAHTYKNLILKLCVRVWIIRAVFVLGSLCNHPASTCKNFYSIDTAPIQHPHPHFPAFRPGPLYQQLPQAGGVFERVFLPAIQSNLISIWDICPPSARKKENNCKTVANVGEKGSLSSQLAHSFMNSWRWRWRWSSRCGWGEVDKGHSSAVGQTFGKHC